MDDLDFGKRNGVFFCFEEDIFWGGGDWGRGEVGGGGGFGDGGFEGLVLLGFLKGLVMKVLIFCFIFFNILFS